MSIKAVRKTEDADLRGARRHLAEMTDLVGIELTEKPEWGSEYTLWFEAKLTNSNGTVKPGTIRFRAEDPTNIKVIILDSAARELADMTMAANLTAECWGQIIEALILDSGYDCTDPA